MRPTPANDRALFLKEQALEVVNRLGELEPIPSHGIGRRYKCPAFRIWYADPATSECDRFHHLDVWADLGKVLSVVWLPDQSPEVVSFKRGPWETYFVA
jgi:hypothetical protein